MKGVGEATAAAVSTEHLAVDVVVVLAGALALAALLFVIVSVRRLLFERSGGTVDCSLRQISRSPGSRSGVGQKGQNGQNGENAEAAEPEPGEWRLGFGRYKGDELHWYRVFGLHGRPRQVIHRRGLVVSGRRSATEQEAGQLEADAAIIELTDGDSTVELAMSTAALTGFLAWLEAAPPGFPIDLPG